MEVALGEKTPAMDIAPEYHQLIACHTRLVYNHLFNQSINQSINPIPEVNDIDGVTRSCSSLHYSHHEQDEEIVQIHEQFDGV